MARTITKDDEDAERERRAKRLVEARKDFGGFTSAAKACARFKWPIDAYKAHESGRNGFSSAAGNLYADSFGVSRKWLYLGLGSPNDVDVPEEAKVVPVFADVPAGRMMPTEGIASAKDIRSHIVISGLGKGDWAALVVNGHSMNKVAPDGSVIVFNRADKRAVDNGFFVFQHPETGDATFKRYGAGNPPRLRPYSYDDFDSIMATEDLVIVGRVRKVVVDL